MSDTILTRSDDAAMQAAIMLKGYCKSFTDCDECVFKLITDETFICVVKKPELWTQIDPYCAVQCRKCGDEFKPGAVWQTVCYQCREEITNNNRRDEV